MEKSKVSNSENVSRLLADNLMFTLINYGAYLSLIDPQQQLQETSIEEHLYLHFLPFIED